MMKKVKYIWCIGNSICFCIRCIERDKRWIFWVTGTWNTALRFAVDVSW